MRTLREFAWTLLAMTVACFILWCIWHLIYFAFIGFVVETYKSTGLVL